MLIFEPPFIIFMKHPGFKPVCFYDYIEGICFKHGKLFKVRHSMTFECFDKTSFILFYSTQNCIETYVPLD